MSSGMGSETDRSAAIREVLRSVFGPELGASVVDLNMVRQMHVIGDHAEISLVLSVPDCPLAGWLVEQARQAALSVPGIATAAVHILDEPWQPPGLTADWRAWVARALNEDERTRAGLWQEEEHDGDRPGGTTESHPDP